MVCRIKAAKNRLLFDLKGRNLRLLEKTLVLVQSKNLLRVSFLASIIVVAFFTASICVNASGAINLSTQITVSSDNQLNSPLNQALLAEPEIPQDIQDIDSASIIDTQQDQELLNLLKNSGIKEPARPKWKTVRMRVTAYCTCPKCCGKFSDGITANLHKIRPGDRFVAADKRYAFGTKMIIPGYNNERAVDVKDRGRLIKGNRLDVFFNSHQTAQKWGARYLDVMVLEKP